MVEKDACGQPAYTLADLKVLIREYKAGRRAALERDKARFEGIDIDAVIARGEATLSDFVAYVEALELQGYGVVKVG